MGSFIIEYLEKKFQHHAELSVKPKQPGPFVTISRQSGCGGSFIANSLARRLNEYYLHIGEEVYWQVISKKIIETSAEVLKDKVENIRFFFDSEQRSLWEDFVQSVTVKGYHSEVKIRNTIIGVIRDFAANGHVIILGRGGAQITQDFQNSLHLKFVASLNWRAERIAQRYNLRKVDALKQIKETDEARNKLIKMLYKGCDQQECYEVTYNIERISGEALILNIIHLMQQKKLI